MTNQMPVKSGLKHLGSAGSDLFMKELKQLIYHKVMEGVTQETHHCTKHAAVHYLMFLKRKYCGWIKGHCCADGHKQHVYKKKDDTQSPQSTQNCCSLPAPINTMEGHQVVTCDVPGEFIQPNIDELLHIKLVGESNRNN